MKTFIAEVSSLFMRKKFEGLMVEVKGHENGGGTYVCFRPETQTNLSFVKQYAS